MSRPAMARGPAGPGEQASSRVPLGAPFLEALRDEIARARRASPIEPVTVIAPSRQSGYFLRQRLAPGGLFNVRFLRLEDLADAIAGERDARLPLTRLRASELVHAVVSDDRVPLPEEMHRLRGRGGFTRAVHRSLDDLDAAAPDEDALRKAGGDRRAASVFRLWQEFRRRAAAFASRVDVARAAAEQVAGDPAVLEPYGDIIFLLVEEPAAQYEPLARVLAGAPGVRTLIGLTGDAPSDALLDRALSAGPGERGEREPGPGYREGTRLVSAPGRAEEVRHVVRDILRRARDGTRFGRMAVLFEDYSYGPRVTQALLAAGMPVAGPSPHTLAQSRHGRFYLGFVRAVESGLTRDAVLAWVTSSDIVEGRGRAVPGQRWELISRRAGLTGGAESWDARLEGYASRLRDRAKRGVELGEADETQAASWEAEAAEALRFREFMRRLVRDAAGLSAETGWEERVEILRAAAGRYLDGMASRDDEPGGESAAVEAALDTLADLDAIGGAPPGLDRFWQTLQGELERPAGLSGRLGGGVFVSPLRLAVGCDFDAVYVVGMSEGNYPSAGTEDPLLPDAARRGVGGLRTLEDGRASARRRFFTALATAPERTLTWPRSQAGASRSMWPSRWFIEMAEALAGEPLNADLSEEYGREWLRHLEPPLPNTVAAAPADRHEFDLKSLWAWRSAGDPLEGHYVLADPGSTVRAGWELERARFTSSRLTEWDGRIGSAPDWAPRSLDGGSSPTRLETWATCPFRFFLSHELRLEATETPEEVEAIDPLDRGRLVHQILEGVVRESIDGEGGKIDRGRAPERLRVLAEDLFAAFEREGLTGRPLLWRLEKERILRGLQDFLRVHFDRLEETGRRPVKTELAFGEGTPVGPVEVALGDGRTISFRGRIDRVDVSPDDRSATVIDYKSGGAGHYSNIKKDPVDAGRRLQLPVYGMAVRQAYPGLEEIDTEFWFVLEGAGAAVVSSRLAESEDRLSKVVAGISDGIASGTFPAYPGAGTRPVAGRYMDDNCAYCPYDRICPGNRRWLWERKSDDPAVRPFTGLQAQ